eukprot:TRINITY_DN11120_c0_g1_i3.p1 TRINITY_DN11120_c0_g1~~TRINITY_DN11120_c0_g1_i3.p1  ORF type:complete len:202 (-),score=40.15 TRINITY_DN11120_c0_g1_i3:367-972(-)
MSGTCRAGMSAIEMIEADLDYLTATSKSMSTSLLTEKPMCASLRPPRSTVACSTHIAESAVMPVSADDAWGTLRSMDFVFSDLVQGGELLSGECPSMVGAVHRLHFRDGSTWNVQVQELSDFNRRLVFDLLERSDGIAVSSCMHEIMVTRITQDDTCLVEWTVDYSNDADAQVIQDTVYKRQADLVALQRYYTAPPPPQDE